MFPSPHPLRIPPITTRYDEAHAPEIAIARPPAGNLRYRNQHYHFSVYYPPDLQVQSYNEDGGAFTVAFQDPTTTSASKSTSHPTAARRSPKRASNWTNLPVS
jgi:hypothetical protein